MSTTVPWYYLPQFRPARLQDCVLWLEPDSFSGGIWRNLAPSYTDRNHGAAGGGVGLSTWHPLFPPALSFDGVDDHVNVLDDDSLDFTNELSIEALINCHNATTDKWGITVIRKQSNYILALKDSGNGPQFKFYLWGLESTAVLLSFPFSLNELTHVVATYDKSQMKIYLNGLPSNARDFSQTLRTSDYILGIGKAIGDSTWYDGIIPLVRIYKAALTPAEVVHNYTHHPLYYLQRGIDPYQVIAAATAAAAPSI